MITLYKTREYVSYCRHVVDQKTERQWLDQYIASGNKPSNPIIQMKVNKEKKERRNYILRLYKAQRNQSPNALFEHRLAHI